MKKIERKSENQQKNYQERCTLERMKSAVKALVVAVEVVEVAQEKNCKFSAQMPVKFLIKLSNIAGIYQIQINFQTRINPT